MLEFYLGRGIQVPIVADGQGAKVRARETFLNL
jgi:hypothetical protein